MLSVHFAETDDPPSSRDTRNDCVLVVRPKAVLQWLHEVGAIDVGDVVDISQTSDQVIQVGYADTELVVVSALGIESKSSEPLSRCL